jgi:glutathione S-transferase
MPDIELYSYDACPYAQRTRMVLAEKGIEFALHEVDPQAKPANWLEISPYGRVPVLRHRGVSIYESSIINQYIEEAFPEPALMPADPVGRAYARIWMDYCETRLLPANNRLLWEPGDAAQHQAKLDAVYEVLRFLETAGLGKLEHGGPFWFGARPGLVDFQYLPFFERYGAYEELAGFRWPDDCSRLRDWFQTMCERDSVRETLRPVAQHVDSHRRVAEAIRRRRAAS